MVAAAYFADAVPGHGRRHDAVGLSSFARAYCTVNSAGWAVGAPRDPVRCRRRWPPSGRYPARRRNARRTLVEVPGELGPESYRSRAIPMCWAPGPEQEHHALCAGAGDGSVDRPPMNTLSCSSAVSTFDAFSGRRPPRPSGPCPHGGVRGMGPRRPARARRDGPAIRGQLGRPGQRLRVRRQHQHLGAGHRRSGDVGASSRTTWALVPPAERADTGAQNTVPLPSRRTGCARRTARRCRCNRDWGWCSATWPGWPCASGT